MTILHAIACFFTGAFLCNAIPHLVSGLQGARFPTPFAKPPGVGDSPAWVNFLWGFFNLLAGLGLLWWNAVAFVPADTGLLLLGALAIGLHLSLHFGKRGRRA